MTGQHVEQRLAAILYADVAGYARLTGADEAGTHRALRAGLAILTAAIEKHGGRVNHYAGDAVLAEFTSAVNCVTAAIDAQRRLAAENAPRPEDKRLRFRIGINLGEVIADGGEIYGDGVNIAARLEALADPGGINVSAEVFNQVRGKIEATFEDRGAREMKNIAAPVHVYAVGADGMDAVAAKTGDAPLRAAERPSIAVLPFENMSGEADQAYFSDGITEDIITELSKYRWFFVTARNSSFTYRDHGATVRDVARDLGVRYVLQGTVRRAGGRVRIGCHLVDAASGAHIWGERYDGELADIFDLQDDITTAIAGAVAPEIAAAEEGRASRAVPESMDAWDHHQRGMWHLWHYTRADGLEAKDHFARAIALEPGLSSAHSGLSLVLSHHVLMGWTEDAPTMLEEARAHAETALTLDPRDAFAHYCMGRIFTQYGETDAALAELYKARELNPNFALTHFGLGFTLVWFGEADEALAHLDRAIRQSPNDPILWSFETIKGTGLWWRGDTADAIAVLNQARRHPNADFWPSAAAAVAYTDLGETQAAAAAVAEALRKRPELTVAAVEKMSAAAAPELRARFLGNLKAAGLPAG